MVCIHERTATADSRAHQAYVVSVWEPLATTAQTAASNPPQSVKGPADRPFLLPFLGLACGVGVASIYYNQPLLLLMGRSVGAGAQSMGLDRRGDAAGLCGGSVDLCAAGRRGRAARADHADVRSGCCVALALLAAARNFPWMLAASVMVGVLASVTHIVLPLAPDLAARKERGRAIGTVMTGLLLGVLLARTFSGWISGLGGWRTVFFAAAVINAAFVPVLWRYLPKLPPKSDLTYRQALRSLWTLFKEEPLLRESAALGMLCFAAHSAVSGPCSRFCCMRTTASGRGLREASAWWVRPGLRRLRSREGWPIGVAHATGDYDRGRHPDQLVRRDVAWRAAAYVLLGAHGWCWCWAWWRSIQASRWSRSGTRCGCSG